MAKHLALVGLPGSGKSTIGRQVARQGGWVFVDADHAIEERLGCRIKDYFAEHGEPLFGRLRHRCCAPCCSAPTTVIATGGARCSNQKIGWPCVKAARCFTCTLRQRISPGGCVVILCARCCKRRCFAAPASLAKSARPAVP